MHSVPVTLRNYRFAGHKGEHEGGEAKSAEPVTKTYLLARLALMVTSVHHLLDNLHPMYRLMVRRYVGHVSRYDE